MSICPVSICLVSICLVSICPVSICSRPRLSILLLFNALSSSTESSEVGTVNAECALRVGGMFFSPRLCMENRCSLYHWLDLTHNSTGKRPSVRPLEKDRNVSSERFHSVHLIKSAGEGQERAFRQASPSTSNHVRWRKTGTCVQTGFTQYI